MGQFDLNLSTRPFRAYQLKSFLLTAALVALAAISIWQGYGFTRYSRLSRQIRGEAQSAKVESEALARRMEEMDSKLNRPEAMAKLSEIEFLNGIIARKSFSWTRIFSNLEEIMPDGAHLLTLRPDFQTTGVVLHIDVQAHGMSDITQLIEALQASPSFDPVDVHVGEKKDPNVTGGDVAVSLSVRFHPDREGQ